MQTILVTGAAGFIGFHVCSQLLSEGFQVVGLDNINSYYDVSLKHDRLHQLKSHPNARYFHFEQRDLVTPGVMNPILQQYDIKQVIHLAAQAGVRYSIDCPQAYIDSNVTGFLNVLESCRQWGVQHLLYASSSSVYGNSKESPFSTTASASHPVSMYAATKRMNEMMAHVFADLYGLPCTGLRFFTVYGPWGRPDMAPMKFAKAMMEGQPIDVYNHGDHLRDFTYIDDIVRGILSILPTPPASGLFGDDAPDRAQAPARVYNIGAQTPVHLLSFIEEMERQLGVVAHKNMLPMQPGDVRETYADVSTLKSDHGYQPSVSIEEGLAHFVRWYREYYTIRS